VRGASGRFSMWMSCAIVGGGGLDGVCHLRGLGTTAHSATLANGVVVAGLSFITAYACIALFMKWVGRIGFFPFMIYRLILGFGLLVFIFAT